MADNEAIFKLTAKLDYNIESTNERLKKLHSIVNEQNTPFPAKYFVDYFSNTYNPHLKPTTPLSDKLPTCSGLSYMASYLLFNKEEKQDGSMTKQMTQTSRNKKNLSLEQEIATKGEDQLFKSSSSRKLFKPTITEQDKKDIPPLQDMDKFISSLVKQIENTKDKAEQYKLKKILTEARQDQYAIKEAYKPKVRSNPSMIETPFVDFPIDFSNTYHIAQLLKYYSNLRHQHYEDPHNDMRYTLDSLDYYIEKANLKELFSRILIRRIDGITYEQLSNELQIEWGLKLSPAYLSSAFVNHIPKLISNAYLDDYELWHYTYIEKGEYKQCTGECKQNKLRTDKYFRKDKKSPDGLSSQCKVCRKNI